MSKHFMKLRFRTGFHNQVRKKHNRQQCLLLYLGGVTKGNAMLQICVQWF